MDDFKIGDIVKYLNCLYIIVDYDDENKHYPYGIQNIFTSIDYRRSRLWNYEKTNKLTNILYGDLND